MKTLTRALFLVAFVIISGLLQTGCHKEPMDEIPTPDPALINDINTLGIRVTVDSITGIDESWAHDIEIYGYVRVWSDFDNTYTSRENYEKEDTCLLWYRDYQDWYRLNKGQSLPINKSVDFFFSRDRMHEARIVMDFEFYDYDSGDDTWSDAGEIDHIVYQKTDPEDDNKLVAIDRPISFRLGDIAFQDAFLPGGRSVRLRNGKQGTEDTGINFHFSFSAISTRSDATLPGSYSTADEFLATDQYPEMPKVSTYELNPSYYSEVLAVGQQEMSIFQPQPLQMTPTGSPGQTYQVYNLQPRFIDGNAVNPNPAFAPKRYYEANAPDEWVGLVRFVGKDPVPVNQVLYGPPLLSQNKPMMQMVRYWKLLDVKRVSAGTTLTHEISYTHGMSTSYQNTTSIKFGWESPDFKIGKFSVEVSHTFQLTKEYSYSTTETSTIQIAAPDDRNLAYATYQLVEEFRILDKDGRLFTDPNYDFAGMTVFTIPTDLIVSKAYTFPTYGR